MDCNARSPMPSQQAAALDANRCWHCPGPRPSQRQPAAHCNTKKQPLSCVQDIPRRLGRHTPLHSPPLCNLFPTAPLQAVLLLLRTCSDRSDVALGGACASRPCRTGCAAAEGGAHRGPAPHDACTRRLTWQSLVLPLLQTTARTRRFRPSRRVRTQAGPLTATLAAPAAAARLDDGSVLDDAVLAHHHDAVLDHVSILLAVGLLDVVLVDDLHAAA